jgi:hypothetical protein
MKKGLLTIVIFIPFTIFLSVFFFNLKINYLESLILIFGIPCILLLLKDKKKSKKVILFSLKVSIPIACIFDLVAFIDNAWIVPQSILPFRIFGFIPLEDFIWMFITTCTILIFYETFFNKNFNSNCSFRIKILLYLLYLIAIFSILIISSVIPKFSFAFSFLWFGLVFLFIPTVIFLIRNTKYIFSFLYVSIYFFYIHLIFELIGLKLNHWVFLGNHYIGWIHFFSFRFPKEELIFVMILGGFAACSYYELFTNKNLN